jgi:hypothetical protein
VRPRGPARSASGPCPTRAGPPLRLPAPPSMLPWPPSIGRKSTDRRWGTRSLARDPKRMRRDRRTNRFDASSIPSTTRGTPRRIPTSRSSLSASSRATSRPTARAHAATTRSRSNPARTTSASTASPSASRLASPRPRAPSRRTISSPAAWLPSARAPRPIRSFIRLSTRWTSGQSAGRYAEGRGYEASTLRWWASRLGRRVGTRAPFKTSTTHLRPLPMRRSVAVGGAPVCRGKPPARPLSLRVVVARSPRRPAISVSRAARRRSRSENARGAREKPPSRPAVERETSRSMFAVARRSLCSPPAIARHRRIDSTLTPDRPSGVPAGPSSRGGDFSGVHRRFFRPARRTAAADANLLGCAPRALPFRPQGPREYDVVYEDTDVVDVCGVVVVKPVVGARIGVSRTTRDRRKSTEGASWTRPSCAPRLITIADRREHDAAA